MKRLLAALFLCVLATGAIAAPSQEQKLAHLEKALGISPQQATQVVQILDEQRQKFRALHEKSGEQMPPCEDLRALKKDTDARLATVLSADQIKKLREMRKDRFKHRGKWRGKEGRDGGPDNMH